MQYQVATRPGRAEAEVVREGQERPSSSSPSVKRRSQDGVRAPQCSSMPKILNYSVDIIRRGSLDRSWWNVIHRLNITNKHLKRFPLELVGGDKCQKVEIDLEVIHVYTAAIKKYRQIAHEFKYMKSTGKS